jgi:hypothetical protein
VNNVLEVRPNRLNDIVMPIGFEQRPMGLEILMIRLGRIRTLKNREELWQEIDKHEAGDELLDFGRCPVCRENVCAYVIANKST